MDGILINVVGTLKIEFKLILMQISFYNLIFLIYFNDFYIFSSFFYYLGYICIYFSAYL